MEFYLVVSVLCGAVFAGFCGWLAGEKNRDVANWAVMGFFFSFVALIALAMAPALPSSQKSAAQPEKDQTKKCPKCAESIKLEAVVCRYCQHEFDPEVVRQEVEQAQQQKEEQSLRIAASTKSFGNVIQELEHGNIEKARQIWRSRESDPNYRLRLVHAIKASLEHRDGNKAKHLLELLEMTHFGPAHYLIPRIGISRSTLLHHAARNNFPDVCEVLIRHGADINARTITGATPLQLAEKNGHTEVARLLRRHGAEEPKKKRPRKQAVYRYYCPHCNAEVHVQAADVGVARACPQCERTFLPTPPE